MTASPEDLAAFTAWWHRFARKQLLATGGHCDMQAGERAFLAGAEHGASRISRARLEGMAPEELYRLRGLLEDVLRAHASSAPGLKVPPTKGPKLLPLVKALREALGLGLREAKDLIEQGAVVEVPDTGAGRRLREMVEGLGK